MHDWRLVPTIALWSFMVAAIAIGAPLRLRPHIVEDPQLGVEAFRLLVPAEWSVEGGIVWRANPTRPATVSLRVFNPIGVEQIGVAPDIQCAWAPTLPALGFRPGSYYLGAEVRPPVADAVTALRTIVLPRYSAQLQGAQITKQEDLPALAQAWAAANYPGVTQGHFSAGKIRIEYLVQGVPAEMDIYGVVGGWTYPLQGVPMTNWSIESIRYSRAPKGKLDDQLKLFQSMAYSERLNIQWLNRYSQVRDMMIQQQMEASNRAVELSRYLARVNDHISATIRQSYETRQAALERVDANFDRYIRGVDQYQDPFKGAPVELPSGYRNVWANASGEYTLSDDANFNPNLGSNRSWRQLQR
jgi:hypothetical protein